ncbi:MAG TPA: DEAD/DEAH box helicase [Leucothrix mucor]|nr:DEAD/DEAH box helicase [Leucothrix mucor]
MSFSELKLQEDFVASIEKAGYQSPTELQSSLIPLVADRKDILVWSQTAAGKTGAFLIPAINYILANPVEEKRGARILILTSRRDRVSQINYTLKRLTLNHNMRFGFVVSGRPYQPQMRLMRRPLDLMIATPGRLNDLIDNNKADFSKLEMLIVDDLTTIYHKSMQTLLDKILSQTGDNCPTIAFVRDDKEVTPYVRKLFPNAEEIKVAEENKPKAATKKPQEQRKKPTRKVEQKTNDKDTRKKPITKQVQKIQLPNTPHIVHVADDYTHKIALMDHFLDEFAGEPTIIHTSTQKSAEKLLDNLANHGHNAELAKNLSNDEMSSPDNATLIISDQCTVNPPESCSQHLLHFELPYKIEKYQQRLQKHASERDDPAIILADGRDYNTLKTIEKSLGTPLEQQTVPGLEPLKPFVSQRPTNQKNTNHKSSNKNSQQGKSTRNKPQDNSKKRIRKGPHGRLDGGAQRKRKKHVRPANKTKSDNWQSDFAEPKERTATPAKRVVIRYKDSKRSLLK